MLSLIIKTAPLNDGTQGFRFVVLRTLRGVYRRRSIKTRYGLTRGPATVGLHIAKRSLSVSWPKSWRKFSPTFATESVWGRGSR